MNKAHTVSNWLAALPVMERARKLSKISHNLTIYAREFQLLPTSSEGKTEVIKKLLGLSELHHKLSAQVVHYCAGEEKAIYPEEVKRC